MNARKITIISTRDQKQSVIMSTAETLADLKADMQEAGIDYRGLAFFERVSKVELKEDESILPHDVPYRGTTTNELVFLLTNVENKIKSGALSRIEAYEGIREYSLQDTCISRFGKNFTQCATAELESLINEAKKARENLTTPTPTPTPCDVQEENYYSIVDTGARGAIRELVDILWNQGDLTYEEQNSILENFRGSNIQKCGCNSYTKEGESSPYSSEELREMLRGI